MSNRTIIVTLAIVFAFTFIACDNGDDDKPVVCTCPEGTTHEPDEKCCEGTDCKCLTEKTYTITLKDGNLVFVVEYKALSTEEPAYLAYLKTRLEVVVNSDQDTSVSAVEHLMSKGSRFTIKVEDTGSSYEGINWDTAPQSFKVHKDWISTASEIDLSAAMLRTAFNAVEVE